MNRIRMQSLALFPVLRLVADVMFPGDHWYPIGKITARRAADSSVTHFFSNLESGSKVAEYMNGGGRADD